MSAVLQQDQLPYSTVFAHNGAEAAAQDGGKLAEVCMDRVSVRTSSGLQVRTMVCRQILAEREVIGVQGRQLVRIVVHGQSCVCGIQKWNSRASG